jgi:hypothetical protein
MNENPSHDDQLFMQLILTFQSAAWQALGKIKNPITDKIERNLDQARFSIDILDMLQRKTEGNLADPLKTILQKSVSELQMNYVAESDKTQNKKMSESEEKAKPEPTEKKTDTDKVQEKKKKPAKKEKAPGKKK